MMLHKSSITENTINRNNFHFVKRNNVETLRMSLIQSSGTQGIAGKRENEHNWRWKNS